MRLIPPSEKKTKPKNSGSSGDYLKDTDNTLMSSLSRHLTPYLRTENGIIPSNSREKIS
jgi:hypothetical protein